MSSHSTRPTKPKLVNFDYESTLLKEMKFDKSTDELLYQMQNDKDVLGRRWAMGELEKKAADAAKQDRIVAAFERRRKKTRSGVSAGRHFRWSRTSIRPIRRRARNGQPPNLDEATEQAMTQADKGPAVAHLAATRSSCLAKRRDPKYASLFIRIPERPQL